MSKIFGKKVSKSFNTFGKKASNGLKTLGKKGGVLDLAERKFFNSIDTIAPAVALVADTYAPGSGQAIMSANDGLQDVHKGIRKGVGQIQKIKKASGADRKEMLVNFADNAIDLKEKVSKSGQLLRDAKNSVQNPMQDTPVGLVE